MKQNLPTISTLPKLSRQDYKAIAALNYSGAKQILKSPAHYQQWLKEESTDSSALRMGSLTHAMVLEPETVNDRFITRPDCDRRTTEGKKIYAEFEANCGDKTSLKHEEIVVCASVANSMIQTLKSLGVSFSAVEFSLSCSLEDVAVKCTIDALGDDGYLYDLKTTEDASYSGFKSSIYKYKYNLQALMYTKIFEKVTGVKPKGFRFIACEKEGPYAASVFEVGKSFEKLAEFDLAKAIEAYRQGTVHGLWPAYPTTPVVVEA